MAAPPAGCRRSVRPHWLDDACATGLPAAGRFPCSRPATGEASLKLFLFPLSKKKKKLLKLFATAVPDGRHFLRRPAHAQLPKPGSPRRAGAVDRSRTVYSGRCVAAQAVLRPPERR